jgi:hypothetical protein
MAIANGQQRPGATPAPAPVLAPVLGPTLAPESAPTLAPESAPTLAPESTSAELSGLYCGLIEADDLSDSGALARIGWTLFAMASTAQQAQCETASLLSELRAAARATAAGEGSPASLALLRHVLGKHGWLPPAGATPLQMLAAPR